MGEQNKKITLVTGLWNINRDQLSESWSRTFDHYLKKFDEILNVPYNLIVFGEKSLESFVFDRRSNSDTRFVVREAEWFKNNEFFEKIQKIRTNSSWYEQAEWLKDSTQAKLEMYNPLVMSKMFLLHDAKILDPFDSDYLFWIDAGLTNTVHPGYFTHDKVIDKLPSLVSDFMYVCFPYEANSEVHGFKYDQLCELANTKTNKVARGGFFGGPKDTISKINSIYYELLKDTLNDGLMGTEESIFTLMVYKYPELIQYSEINQDGLVGRFFENIKTNTISFKRQTKLGSLETIDLTDTALYVITFNSPDQFKTLIESMLIYDKEFLTSTKKFLLDNSTDETTFNRYADLCLQYNFEHIKKNNIGICGGRQFIAEHFDQTDSKYMLFFEDDMFLYPHEGQICKCGFNRYVKNLFAKTMKIVTTERFDFLKLSFAEFYGDNSTQWAWYNVPQKVREEYWPEYSTLPKHGLDKNSPKTQFANIKTLNDVSYATGEIYYCNWPQVVSKEGNKKMFINTKWAHPYEQTWMSHIYQLTKNKQIHPGILLLSPIEHNRFSHYSSAERREN
jgi:hypothetical protein